MSSSHWGWIAKYFSEISSNRILGERYSFLNSSASMVTVLDKALFSLSEEMGSSFSSWWLWVAIVIVIDKYTTGQYGGQ